MLLTTSRRAKGASVIFVALFTYVLWARLDLALSHDVLAHPSLDYSPRATYSQKITTNLIIASTSKEDTSWASNLQIPNLKVLRYVSDSATAKYHPATLNKGREALIYFTYLVDFYDDLPDVSIFIHAEETPWHMEGTLMGNTSFALSRLDLKQVIERQYFNLRVTWRASCPAWINTTKTNHDRRKSEEPYMREAWEANFSQEEPVPEILAGPCCSQFAVSREAIRSRPRAQYQRSMEWLQNTPWSDYIAGRVWEHMWPYLFKKEAKDCAPEIPTLCKLYGICFRSKREMDAFLELWEERERLKEDLQPHRVLWRPQRAADARREIAVNALAIQRTMQTVLEREELATPREPHGS
ncbi:hypothetical protein Slin15195_G116010 [Septoria linicola]|uniref:Uncharacterized protein n=1 Tax=Septoria linicola TaxID=215465 RepID=A0A9Q9AYE7_9PEZI|nr:hypothetical protein Slin15195_G116010 [Septoria linicola]